MPENNDTPKEVNEPAVKYNLPISFSTLNQLDEEEMKHTASLSPEQRFDYLHELRKATHNLNLSAEEKKALLNTIIINPPNGY